DLMLECEKAKRRVSKMAKTLIRLHAGGHEHVTEITRDKFESLTAPALARYQADDRAGPRRRPIDLASNLSRCAGWRFDEYAGRSEDAERSERASARYDGQSRHGRGLGRCHLCPHARMWVRPREFSKGFTARTGSRSTIGFV